MGSIIFLPGMGAGYLSGRGGGMGLATKNSGGRKRGDQFFFSVGQRRGPEFFCKQRGDQNFLCMQGGAEKIGNPRSQTDNPPSR